MYTFFLKNNIPECSIMGHFGEGWKRIMLSSKRYSFQRNVHFRKRIVIKDPRVFYIVKRRLNWSCLNSEFEGEFRNRKFLFSQIFLKKLFPPLTSARIILRTCRSNTFIWVNFFTNIILFINFFSAEFNLRGAGNIKAGKYTILNNLSSIHTLAIFIYSRYIT